MQRDDPSRALIGGLALAALALAPAPPTSLSAQEPSRVSGHVRDALGLPLPGVDVFLLETLDGALTDSAGAFGFDTRALGAVTLVAQRPGFLEVRRAVTLPLAAPLAIVLQPAPIAMDPITVEAGTFRLGSLPDVTLDDLEVVRTPGAAADPFRAIQTFPGLQSVGEGAGLFVRGGDVSETRVLLDGATVLSPFRLDTDRTVSFGRFDPFQLRGISFSAGGFGAEHGDALSAIVDLRSVDRPAASEVGVTAAVGGVSAGLNWRASPSLGARVTASRTDTELLMRLSGRRDEFERVPASTDLSGGAEWTYRPGGRVKAFAMLQTDEVGVRIEEAAHAGIFRSDARADLIAVSGLDAFGRVGFAWGLATSGSRQDQDFGGFRLEREERLNQARAKLEVPLGRGVDLAAGAEIEDRSADLAGSIPVESHDKAPGAPVVLFASHEPGARLGAFGELDLQPTNALRLLVGLRADHSSFTGRLTADPRLSATWRPAGPLSLTAAWGVFHQVPDPLRYEPALGIPELPAMSARHWIGGASYDTESHMLRIEVYRKEYEHLASRTRNGVTRGDGTGRATGVDLFVKGGLGLLGLDGRLAYSIVDSERTDPDTGLVVPSPFDATHTLTLVLNRAFGERLQTGVAYRASTGIPFTPIGGARLDPSSGVWEPIHGPPMSERFPRYSRLDLSADLLHSFAPGSLTVFFVSIMNALDRLNVSDYRYSRDYSERIPIKTPFTRSIYFGVTTTLPL